MAAHRYWRLRATALLGAGGKAGIAEMEMREAPGGANLPIVYGGTIMSNGYVGYSYDTYVFDGGTGNYWISGYGAGDWVGWDFGVGVAYDVREIKITNAGNTSYTVDTAEFEWSDDGSSWTIYISIPTRGNVAGATTTHVYLVPGNATLALTAPSPSLLFTGGINAPLSAPSPTLRLYGGANATLTGPSPRLYAAGHDSTLDNPIILTAPMQTLAVFAGAMVKMQSPSPTLTSAATGKGLITAALVGPSPTLTATATFGGVIRTSPFMGAPMGTLIGYSGAVIAIALTGEPTLQSSVTCGAVGSIVMTAPLFELTATATQQNYGSALLTAPMPYLARGAVAYLVSPGFSLTIIGTATVAATYEAYALNLNHSAEGPDELTRYTNYPFTHIVRYKNSYFGAAADGLYLLEGTTDDGTDIAFDVKTHKTDFDTAQKKSIIDAFIGGRMGASATITLHVGETSSEAYAYTTPRGSTAQNYRQQFGKGIKNRYYAFEIAGSGALSVDTITFNIATLARKV